MSLLLALPSKGRLKEQAEAWLGDSGLGLEVAGGARGYRAALTGIEGVEAPLLSSSDIASALDAGDVHLGVVGEDLLRERGGDIDERVMLLRPLGFGRADLVVAAPQSWIDVQTMADVDQVAMAYLARTGRRMRVATKYGVLTRAFFARHGVADYRIVDSSGATEGAPAAGAAELIVDITTTGATLQANGLRPLADGLILKSQAQLAASLKAPWTPETLDLARRFVRVIEARARARQLAALTWPADQDRKAEAATVGFVERGASRQQSGLLVRTPELFEAAEALAAAGVGPVSAARPDYVFHADCPIVDALQAKLPAIV
jgi:ATP phosphoribosyltransferase